MFDAPSLLPHLMLQHVPGVGDAPVALPAEVPHGRLHAALQPVAHLTQPGHQKLFIIPKFAG